MYCIHQPIFLNVFQFVLITIKKFTEHSKKKLFFFSINSTMNWKIEVENEALHIFLVIFLQKNCKIRSVFQQFACLIHWLNFFLFVWRKSFWGGIWWGLFYEIWVNENKFTYFCGKTQEANLPPPLSTYIHKTI